MAELTDSMIEAALVRGAQVARMEPRAKAVRYDAAAHRVVVDLTNDATFAFPPALVEGLGRASGAQLAEVKVTASGYGIHWEALDIDLSVPGLLAGLFGTQRHMARRAGRAKSPAKAAAARANGAKGGRPRKSV